MVRRCEDCVEEFFVFCDEGEEKADDIGTMARSESVRVSKMLTMGELLVF